MENTEKNEIFRFQPIPVAITIISSALCGWAASSLAGEGMQWLTGIATGVMLALMLSLAGCCTNSRQAHMVRVASMCFVVLAAILNIVLALTCHTAKPFIIIDGLFLMLWAIVIYALYRSRPV